MLPNHELGSTLLGLWLRILYASRTFRSPRFDTTANLSFILVVGRLTCTPPHVGNVAAPWADFDVKSKGLGRAPASMIQGQASSRRNTLSEVLIVLRHMHDWELPRRERYPFSSLVFHEVANVVA